MLALNQEKVTVLAERIDRVRKLLGTNGKKPRYNAVLSVTTDDVREAQNGVEDVLATSPGGGSWMRWSPSRASLQPSTTWCDFAIP